MFNQTCKNVNDALTLEERYVLFVCCNTDTNVRPSAYTEAIIKALYIAMAEKIGYATQLAAIHPELAHAVNCLINGNLQDVYAAHKVRQAELLAELEY